MDKVTIALGLIFLERMFYWAARARDARDALEHSDGVDEAWLCVSRVVECDRKVEAARVAFNACADWSATHGQA
jgi:hypothetical protein